MPNKTPRRAPQPLIRRNYQYLTTLVGAVMPFGETAARKAEANAASAMHTYKQKDKIDEILQEHHDLAAKIDMSQ